MLRFPGMIPQTPFSTLARAIARSTPPAELLADLHDDVLSLTGGTVSVILEPVRRGGGYAGTSGRGCDHPSEIRLTSPEAALMAEVTANGPATADLQRLPGLDRLGATRALLVPLPTDGDPAYLVVAGANLDEATALATGTRAQVEFSLALRLERLARRASLHDRVREVLLGFSRGISGTLSIGPALDALAVDTNGLFGGRRTTVWLHQRRSRAITLAASSGTGGDAPVPTDGASPAARGMRLERPRIEADADGPILLAPLRGWRRSLGTIVIEGVGLDLDDRELTDAANELARQLSIAIENVLLLEDVLQQRRLLEDTFNALVDLVVVTDKALRIVQTNEAFAARTGIARPDLLQRPLLETIGPAMAAWMQEAGTPAHATRSRQFADERLGGLFTATITPLINQEGEPAGKVLVISDITERTRLEGEQAALRERLAQSEKLAALGQFVAGIAHEMNNPLQGVLGHLELLMTTSEEAKPLRPTLRRIYQEGDRAAKIVRDLLIFAGSRRRGYEAMKLPNVVARVVSSRTAALRRAGIAVEQHVADNVPAIDGDAQLLQQAFLNIVINAEHAAASTSGPRQIQIGISPAGPDIVRTTIHDSGPGIADDVLPRIFDPFFTTKEVGKGTGLGLAITYGIIQEHGGTIHAGNAPGGGAIFTIDLPASQAGPQV
jgi:PAS domain S-box-containing protein